MVVVVGTAAAAAIVVAALVVAMVCRGWIVEINKTLSLSLSFFKAALLFDFPPRL